MRIIFLLLSVFALFILSISGHAEAKCSFDSDGNLMEPCGPPGTTKTIDPIRSPFALNDLVLVGNVVSSTPRLAENQTTYYIEVEKYLKNPKPYDLITAIGKGVYNKTMEYYSDVDFFNKPVFADGDKVFLYLTNKDGNYRISPLSFAISRKDVCCRPVDDITITRFASAYRPNETITMSGEVRKGQLYEYMLKNEDATVNIQVHNSKNELIKNSTAYIRPDGTFSHKIIIRDQVGDYGADAIFGSMTISDVIRIIENVGCCDPLDKIESVFNSKNGTGLVVLKTHEEVNIIFTSSELTTRRDSDGSAGYAIHDNNKLITDSENFTANELPKTFTFSFTPPNTGIFVFTKGIKFNSDDSYGTESQSVIVLEKFSKSMAFNGQCKKPFPEFTLIIRSDFSTGACVKMDTASKLRERGWH